MICNKDSKIVLACASNSVACNYNNYKFQICRKSKTNIVCLEEDYYFAENGNRSIFMAEKGIVAYVSTDFAHINSDGNESRKNGNFQ